MVQVFMWNCLFLHKRDCFDMIYVVDDDEIMAECIAGAIDGKIKVFSNAYEVMDLISDGEIPEMIFLDVLLDGPDAFTFLNELVSYDDTKKIPIVIVSSLDFGGKDLSEYGVVGVLNKDTMKPEDIKEYANEYAGHQN